MHHVRRQHTAHTSLRLPNSHQCQQQTPTANDDNSNAHTRPRITMIDTSSPTLSHHTDSLTHLPHFPRNRDKRTKKFDQICVGSRLPWYRTFLTYLHAHLPLGSLLRRPEEAREKTKDIVNTAPTPDFCYFCLSGIPGKGLADGVYTYSASRFTRVIRAAPISFPFRL